ncbi:MAG TPA: helix-turn-helix domain-containing protein [Herpetosiphonaceae bacterium]
MTPDKEPQPPPADPERQGREQRILDAAAALMVRWGYRKTTIDDVAREAGVGKGTIYLHWKDKQQLFQAAILHQQRLATEDVQRRIAADPAGGLFHRWVSHSIAAALDYPLLAAMLQGRSDIYNGVVGAYDPATLSQLASHFDAVMLKLQQGGLIRSDIPVPTATFLVTALKIGVINTPELLGKEHTPPLTALTEAMSDLIRRWLEPDDLPEESALGKQLADDLIDHIKDYETLQGAQHDRHDQR